MTCCTNVSEQDFSPLLIDQGEDKTFVITATEDDGSLYGLTGAEIYFLVRRVRDQVIVMDKRTLNAGGSDTQILVLAQSGATLGQAEIYIVPADTTVLDINEQYEVMCWLVTTANKSKTVIQLREFVIMPTIPIPA